VVLREVLTAYGARDAIEADLAFQGASEFVFQDARIDRRVFAWEQECRSVGEPRSTDWLPEEGQDSCPEPGLCARTEARAPNADFDGTNPFQPRSFPDELAAQTYFGRTKRR
jgi:hypothetical protein